MIRFAYILYFHQTPLVDFHWVCCCMRGSNSKEVYKAYIYIQGGRKIWYFRYRHIYFPEKIYQGLNSIHYQTKERTKWSKILNKNTKFGAQALLLELCTVCFSQKSLQTVDGTSFVLLPPASSYTSFKS